MAKQDEKEGKEVKPDETTPEEKPVKKTDTSADMVNEHLSRISELTKRVELLKNEKDKTDILRDIDSIKVGLTKPISGDPVPSSSSWKDWLDELDKFMGFQD